MKCLLYQFYYRIYSILMPGIILRQDFLLSVKVKYTETIMMQNPGCEAWTLRSEGIQYVLLKFMYQVTYNISIKDFFLS